MWVGFNRPHAILTDYYPISSVSLQSRCRVLLISIPDFRCTAHFHESRIDDKNLLNSVWVCVWNKIFCTCIFICRRLSAYFPEPIYPYVRHCNLPQTTNHSAVPSTRTPRPKIIWASFLPQICLRSSWFMSSRTHSSRD